MIPGGKINDPVSGKLVGRAKANTHGEREGVQKKDTCHLFIVRSIQNPVCAIEQ